MDYQQENNSRQPNPRRRERSPKRLFFEAYLPVLLAVALIILVIVLIANNNRRLNQQREQQRQESIAAQQLEDALLAAERQKALECMEKAKAVAATYDFQAAIDILDSFGSDIFNHDDMLQLRDSYKNTLENMVEYTPEQVVHLSVNLLIADAERAFRDPKYGVGYQRSFITTKEFTNLLYELYSNNYVLVDMDDLVDVRSDGTVSVFSPKKLRLPQGKKPLMLTETQVNYYSYMVDPDGDGKADENGAGFASRLILENDKFVNEMVDAEGNVITGSFDVVPILEEFLLTHPDFSYHGARPILAVTGYNGIFGYRGEALAEVTPLLQALRDKGYTIAFYTYGNADYNASTLSDIRTELKRWNERIVPTLGETNMLVYAREADIAAPGPYSGDKFEALYDDGYRYFLGYCTDGKPWFLAESNYIRQGRIPVSAHNLTEHADWFSGIINPSAILEAERK